MPKAKKTERPVSHKKLKSERAEDIAEHMTRSEMVAEIMCMLADADAAKLRRIMDEVVKPEK